VVKAVASPMAVTREDAGESSVDHLDLFSVSFVSGLLGEIVEAEGDVTDVVFNVTSKGLDDDSIDSDIEAGLEKQTEGVVLVGKREQALVEEDILGCFSEAGKKVLGSSCADDDEEEDDDGRTCFRLLPADSVAGDLHELQGEQEAFTFCANLIVRNVLSDVVASHASEDETITCDQDDDGDIMAMPISISPSPAAHRIYPGETMDDADDDENFEEVLGIASDEEWIEEDTAFDAERFMKATYRSAKEQATAPKIEEHDLQEQSCCEIDFDNGSSEVVIESPRDFEEQVIDYVCSLLDEGITSAAHATSNAASGINQSEIAFTEHLCEESLGPASLSLRLAPMRVDCSSTDVASTSETLSAPAKPTSAKGLARPIPRSKPSETKKKTLAQSPLSDIQLAAPLAQQSPPPAQKSPEVVPLPASSASPSPLQSSRSKRRIIGGVVRTPAAAEAERELGSAFRMDLGDDSDTGCKSAPQPKLRQSSLPRMYDALSADFYHLDSPIRGSSDSKKLRSSPTGSLKGPPEREGNVTKGAFTFDYTFGHANVQQSLFLGAEKSGMNDPLFRSSSWATSLACHGKQDHGLATNTEYTDLKRQPLKAVAVEVSKDTSAATKSALAMDLGLCSPPSTSQGSRASLPPSEYPLLARSPSLGKLRVTKKQEASGNVVVPPSSGSFAWSMHMAKAAAKRGRPLSMVL
jgi:hypothetical protein